ncbi:hypothetical protein DSM112329_04895 [Paraconexibacter sp. AEG42_29]|uniref:Uncharacterized protein n=1 Tax=Paraconexibacter sp. AEG42_29 TaxID=2997339 RepID=A0AAU7B2B7_9ACTN
MSRRSRGRTALVTTAVAAVAVLGSAGSAWAALGGGKVPALTDRPNLVSVTTSGTAITFTYDRTINCTCNGGDFLVGEYSFAGLVEYAGTSATVSGSSVRVTYAGGTPDTDPLTYGRVVDGAVSTQGTLGATNLGDSIKVTGAAGETGTRGHTSGPDLVSAVATGGGLNLITLTFDQDVNEATFNPNTVYAVKADGSAVTGVTATADDNVVDVEFGPGTPVAGVKSVGVSGSAQSINFPFASPQQSVKVGTQNQDSQAPILLSAELTGADAITYTFDKRVTDPNIAFFTAYTPDTFTPVTATAATVVGDGTKVQAQFPTDQYTEYLVQAGVDFGAVLAQADGTPNALQGAPVGGNTGAKATGYTAAPDAVQATFSGANVVVTLDSRILAGSVTAANFVLLADDGTAIGGTPTATPQAQGIPGPSRVNLLYNTTAVGNARAVRLLPNAVLATEPSNLGNIDQQLGR